jgi:hypothetical protein
MSWTKLEYAITNKLNEPVEFELLCELRALAGEVWFDVSSLKLVKTDLNPRPPVVLKQPASAPSEPKPDFYVPEVKK